MDLSEQSFQRFIDLIYAAAEEPQRWRRFYEELQVAVGVRSIHMLGIDKRVGTLAYSDGANMPVEGELAYMHHYRLADPRPGAHFDYAPVGDAVLERARAMAGRCAAYGVPLGAAAVRYPLRHPAKFPPGYHLNAAGPPPAPPKLPHT